jgi:hypothetical protein
LPASKELETYPVELEEGKAREVSVDVNEDAEEVDYHAGPRDARKSPAALFGSQSIGQVVLPFELQKSIGLLISGEPYTFPVNHSPTNTFLSRFGQNDASQRCQTSLRSRPSQLRYQLRQTRKKGRNLANRIQSQEIQNPTTGRSTRSARRYGVRVRGASCSLWCYICGVGSR